jgi:hypothetical protein
MTQFFGCHSGHFSSKITPFFDLTRSKIRLHIDANFWKPNLKHRLHTYAIFVCQPVDFSSTLSLFVGATLESSPAA